MKHGIMNAFEELQRRLNDRRCNRDKFAKDVCEAWCALYQALGGTITGTGYVHGAYGILPNATRCIGLIVAARSFSESFDRFLRAASTSTEKTASTRPHTRRTWINRWGFERALGRRRRCVRKKVSPDAVVRPLQGVHDLAG